MEPLPSPVRSIVNVVQSSGKRMQVSLMVIACAAGAPAEPSGPSRANEAMSAVTTVRPPRGSVDAPRRRRATNRPKATPSPAMGGPSARGKPSVFEGGAAVPGSRLPAAAPAALDELVGWSVDSGPMVERTPAVASVASGAPPVELGVSVDSGASLDVGLSIVVGSSVEVGAAEPE